MNNIQGNCCFCVKELESIRIKIQACGNDEITYINKLKSVFQDLIIPRHMYLPTSMCSTCCENLNQAYEFKEQCFRSLNYWNELGEPEIDPEAVAAVDISKVKTEADPLLIEDTEEDNNKSHNGLNANKVFTFKSEITVENDDGTEEHFQDDNLELDPDQIYKDTSKENEYILNFGSHFISSTLKCDFCHIKCENVDELRQHLLKTHPKLRTYECKICGRNFSQEGRLQMHLLVHTDERNFECSYCHNKYKTNQTLDRHIRREHTKEKRVNKCDVCGLVCKTRSSLYYHKSKHKNPITQKAKTIEERNYVRNITYKAKELLYPCDICTKSFANQKGLNRHLRRHYNRNSHKCKICGKRFTASSSLKNHAITHTDEKKYKCTQCPKTFKTQGTLVTHMDIHLDRIHTCAFCDKTFNNLSSFYTHKKTHRPREETEPTKPKDPPENVIFVGPKLQHACDICPKSFSTRTQLRQHKLTHSLTKKFVCSDCGKSFTTLGNLKAHLLSHGKEKNFTCDDCGKKFKTDLTLKIHKKKICKQTNNTARKLEQAEHSDSTS